MAKEKPSVRNKPQVVGARVGSLTLGEIRHAQDFRFQEAGENFREKNYGQAINSLLRGLAPDPLLALGSMSMRLFGGKSLEQVEEMNAMELRMKTGIFAAVGLGLFFAGWMLTHPTVIDQPWVPFTATPIK